MGQRFFKETIRDVDVRGRTVLVRVDYNVPLTADGKISDDLRIRASLPTLRYLLGQDCKIVLLSHLGRPAGRDERLSLLPIAQYLANMLGRPVKFIDDVVGDRVRQLVRHSGSGDIIVLENVRFFAEEEANDPTFARAIAHATAADYFVQDGFGVVHRAHASTDAITLYIPSVAGLLVEKEVSRITDALDHAVPPMVAIVGGAKVGDKVELIERCIERADHILIGGAMANTFLAYKGHAMGASTREAQCEKTLDRLYQVAASKVGATKVDEVLLLPEDVVVAHSCDAVESAARVAAVDQLGQDEAALDIGPRTVQRFCQVIKQAGTIIWNGPLGYTENPVFARGSAQVAAAICAAGQAVSIIGGGDTADFVRQWSKGRDRCFSHISTGGGASMELMAGKKLPGIDRLLDAHGLGCYTKHKEYDG